MTDGRVERAKRRREARRQQILEAATHVFAEQGYQSASLNDILDHAGIARGTFYLYFENADAVFLELVNQLVALLIEAVTPVDSAESDAIEQLYENVENAVSVLFEHQRLARILLREAIGIGGAVGERITELDRYMIAMMEGALTKGAAAGWIREIERPAIVAAAVIGGLKEIFFQMLIRGNLDRETPETVARAVFDYGTRGLFKS